MIALELDVGTETKLKSVSATSFYERNERNRPPSTANYSRGAAVFYFIFGKT
jgi:hypothetical protein